MKTKLTKEQGIIISAYTGILACNFADLHKAVEKKFGRPIFTHEFAYNKKEIKEAFKDDFMEIVSE